MTSGARVFSSLDSLLRGERTNGVGEREADGLKLSTFVPWALVLGAVTGFFTGWYAIASGREGAVWHMLAVMIKLPALFLLTLLVTFPSLYVFNAMLGSRLSFATTLRLLVATIVVNLAVGASLGPILGFFTLSTSSYGFMVLLNVLLLGLAGLVSVGFLLRALVRLNSAVPDPVPVAASVVPPAPSESAGDVAATPGVPPLRPDAATVQRLASIQQAGQQRAAQVQSTQRTSIPLIFLVWIVTYGVVGAQMGWILRPFIGSPNMAFTVFRPRGGSVLEGIWAATRSLF